MTRLPEPGSDDGAWGTKLNDYLSQVHNADGSLKDISQNKVTGLTDALAAKANASDVYSKTNADSRFLQSATVSEMIDSALSQVSLNPLLYGAAGDGTADDTAGLQAALDEAKSRGIASVDGGGRTY